MNVLVYSGSQGSETPSNWLLETLRSILVPHYTVQPISNQTLRSQPWSTDCALLIFNLCDNRPTIGATAIRSYVENGGRFLGLGLGAQFSLRSAGDGVLGFRDSASGAHIDLVYPKNIERHPRSVSTVVSDTESIDALYESTKCDFAGAEGGRNAQILGRYADADRESLEIAGLKFDVGQGQIGLLGFDLERPILAVETAPSQQETYLLEEKRRNFLQTIIQQLGLQIPTSTLPISHPLPQFLTGHPQHPAIVSQIADSLALTPGATPGSSGIFDDANDVFHFHPLESAPSLIQECRDRATDPSSNPPDEPGHSKHIVTCANGQLPDPKLTPLFDFKSYFDALQSDTAQAGHPANAWPWHLGEALLYGEVVTSTQTMLDRNPRFLSLLPIPLVSLASQQLTGRGRGSNSWLSPAGCLQFSILFRLSLASFQASKLVFIQYLFALAVVEACRDDAVLGSKGKHVRLKWPNDLYIDTGNERKKIGGVLINTSFTGGTVAVVIGCGLNVLNPPPMSSLSQLQHAGDPPLSIERTVATILAKFEKMWSEFVQGSGSFDPFMSLYLERWLHSDQLVTLTTTTPPRSVRICGITSDHGLLRTLPERSGWSSKDEGYIDLQPDGNSFDLMAGLIKTKS